MGLLPEFFTLLGIEIFAAMSLVSVLLDRDIPSSAQCLHADWEIYWTGAIARFIPRRRGDAENTRAVGSEGHSRRVGGVPEEGSSGIEQRDEGALRSWRQQCSQTWASSVIDTIDRR